MTNIFIETYGCSQNFADSEQMAGLLQTAQFPVVEKIEDAFIVIINTCTVKGPTESAFFKRLEEIKAMDPPKLVIIAGCIPQTDPEKLKSYSLLGTKQIHKVVEIVEEALSENKIKLLECQENPPLHLPRLRKNSLIGIIPIARGCLGHCTYCKTKAARGDLVSYPILDIKKEVEIALRDGAKEIWLTSQDCGCYGFDLNTNLPNLLKELITLPPSFKIRIGMMNPNHLMKIKEELLPLYREQKIYQFLHLPVQSGNNEILKKMGREYTREQFLELVTFFRKELSSLTLATDVIVGFPAETEEQFWETQTLLREINPDAVNISRFWPRGKTPAGKLVQLAGEKVKHRSRVITEMCHNIFKLQNERWRNWEGYIMLDEKGREPGQWFGRNFAYKPVMVIGNYKMGQVLPVKITKFSEFYIKGEVQH